MTPPMTSSAAVKLKLSRPLLASREGREVSPGRCMVASGCQSPVTAPPLIGNTPGMGNDARWQVHVGDQEVRGQQRLRDNAIRNGLGESVATTAGIR